MALASHCAAPSSQLFLGLKHSTAISTLLSPFPITSKLRSSAAVRLRIRRELPIVFASKPSGENPAKKKSDDAPQPQGPPLPTILAGLALFFLLFWIAQSIITWLVGFLVSLIPFK